MPVDASPAIESPLSGRSGCGPGGKLADSVENNLTGRAANQVRHASRIWRRIGCMGAASRNAQFETSGDKIGPAVAGSRAI